MTIYTLTSDLQLKVASFPIRIGPCSVCKFEKITMQCDVCDEFVCQECSIDSECSKREGKPHFLDF